MKETSIGGKSVSLLSHSLSISMCLNCYLNIAHWSLNMSSAWASAVEKMGLKSDSKVKAQFFISKHLGEGTSNPLQYSCLGNPWTEEPGELKSMGSQKVRHNLATKPPAYVLPVGTMPRTGPSLLT